MTHIIIVDMRENCGQILAIRDNEDDPQWLAQFDTEKEAEELMSKHLLRAFPYEIIDMGG